MKFDKLTFANPKDKNNPDSVKPSDFCIDELGHLNTIITLHPPSEQSYNGTKPDINFDDEVRWGKRKLIPKDLADALTKETLNKLGIKK